jgi:malonyl-CoA decarboxylase
VNQTRFLQEIASSITARGLRMLDFSAKQADPRTGIAALCHGLLSSAGEASGIAAAERILRDYALLSREHRLSFFGLLLNEFGVDADEVVAAAEAYRNSPTADRMRHLQAAVEPRRQELLRRLNLAPDGTHTLVQMRVELLGLLEEHPYLEEVEIDFLHLFQSWFNRGFLELRRIDWHTPAAILDKVIKYEAVHRIPDWDALRRRIDPPDRRLYAFFHPRLTDEPLIFVEVALMMKSPAAIDDILALDREAVRPEEARIAAFYSISNCQEGLRGVSFGNFLIKQVVECLRREFPGLNSFVTLSPIPGFARWLDGLLDVAPPEMPEMSAVIADMQSNDWADDPSKSARLEPALLALAAHYLTKAKASSGVPLDPVARFHGRNGARLERINWKADVSPAGLENGHGIMVNYAYRVGEIERNHETFASTGRLAVSNAVARLAKQFSPMRSAALQNDKATLSPGSA